jgi:hypothetical protein
MLSAQKWMELEIITLGEISQSHRPSIMFSFICGVENMRGKGK